ncbi:hypothetical protein EJ05DRAFT_21976 [Pseudovirgaria hyperparasitica]|uniref:C2H2-type domain-containing protein n=1 Tax=Pseudovirgaria hyperparasitica TaxID=470096 RepID=A0A6A6WLD7_9PEZI|nr:uncharacterized protein EJ05DRAFT_21976 [Pseudovirgaria hyperparasitica]KAF2762968.1 hypothetical protein EJ05DRAFT_21976 [Pseudovirgaria hyperparasitica]
MTAQVLSVHTGYTSEFGQHRESSMSAISDTPRMGLPTPASPNSGDDPRGRRRTREDEDQTHDGDNGDDADGADPGGSSRKRRRSRKGLDKKFDCPHEGCGKSYSRAEHLYRHQLNHNPKQIYRCDFPDCNRSFVRQDLCARHKERHTARGSQLLRKDTFMHNANPIVTAALEGQKSHPQQGQHSPTVYMRDSPASAHPSSATVGSAAVGGSSISPPLNATLPSPASESAMRSTAGYGRRDERYDMTPRAYNNHQQGQRTPSFGAISAARPNMSPHTSNDGFARPGLPTQASGGHMQTYNQSNNSPYSGPTGQQYNSQAPQAPQGPQDYKQYTPSSASYQAQQSIPQFNNLPPPGFQTMNNATDARGQPQGHHTPQTSHLENGQTAVVSDTPMLGTTPGFQSSIPVFGGEGYSRSPFAMADDFAAWLFNESNLNTNGGSAMNLQHGSVAPGLGSSSTIGLQAPYFNYDPVVSGYYTPQAPQQHPMAVNSILDTSLPESALSEEKRSQLIDLIEERFNETDHAPVKRQKAELLEGNRDGPHHILSLHMMQTFIASYWSHFHPQMPILHRPTFNAASCPNILLLAVMAVGAACLEKNHGYDTTQTCSELANFLAWHLRWEVFMDADFRPPAKLWIFQALILLEIFEKMFSTRPLHERAHIHHATTLTLMRRGSSLIGRSAMDSPPSTKDPKSNGSASTAPQTPDEWWNHWISNEATRRAAFAAFVMDSIHATMFGHSAVMVAHEMRLPLPCDETLWSATSGAEVGRIETSLHNNGVKPTTFLEGLKKTLNGQAVHTNAFGRNIIMAGLLSVTWHMNQRDLQVTSLGVSQALGGRDKWRGALTRAFDFWKTDFDGAVAKVDHAQQHQTGSSSRRSALDDNLMYESRTVLHHLAHMAMHVDIVDCQIYAGATRLLGRSITSQDANGAQKRMKEVWAPTAKARDATFYALRFLSQVLIPEDRPNHSSLISSVPMQSNPDMTYVAREDFLLNRPWVLYFAVLIVWSYGYALDGPLSPAYTLNTHDECVRDMQGYLRRVGTVRAPDDLAKLQNRNACLGLLVLMRDMFKKTRWELLHEASVRLTKCIELLAP